MLIRSQREMTLTRSHEAETLVPIPRSASQHVEASAPFNTLTSVLIGGGCGVRFGVLPLCVTCQQIGGPLSTLRRVAGVSGGC